MTNPTYKEGLCQPRQRMQCRQRQSIEHGNPRQVLAQATKVGIGLGACGRLPDVGAQQLQFTFPEKADPFRSRGPSATRPSRNHRGKVLRETPRSFAACDVA